MNDLHTRNRIARGMVESWEKRQYPLIEKHRGQIVARACKLEAKAIAEKRAWFDDPKPVTLSTAEIDICQARVISSERVMAYGPYALRTPDNGARWQRETEICKQAILGGKHLTDSAAPPKHEKPIAEELADIANRPPTRDQQAVAAARKAKQEAA